MTLKELISESNPIDVVNQLIKLYPDQKNQKEAYIQLVEKLKNVIPSEEVGEDAPYLLYVTHMEEDEDSYESVEVYSLKTKLNYGFEFEPFSVWLALNISLPSLNFYGKDVFLAHVLWEMTFVSMDEEKILKEKAKLTESYKSLLDDVKSSIKDFEELKEELGLTESDLECDEPDWEKINSQQEENRKGMAKMLGLQTDDLAQ